MSYDVEVLKVDFNAFEKFYNGGGLPLLLALSRGKLTIGLIQTWPLFGEVLFN